MRTSLDPDVVTVVDDRGRFEGAELI